jgi:hypothetical protein
MIKCEICGREYKRRYFKTFLLEIREIWGFYHKLIDPIRIKVCFKCSEDRTKILSEFIKRLNEVDKTYGR